MFRESSTHSAGCRTAPARTLSWRLTMRGREAPVRRPANESLKHVLIAHVIAGRPLVAPGLPSIAFCMTSPKPAELPVRLFKNDAAWDAWLAKQHAKSAGLWLRIAKAGSDVKTVSYAEALDVALCYGWIDGQKKT